MAGLSRDFLLKKGAVTVASLRQKSFAIDFSSVDVTTDDSAGYQTLLTKAGKVAISVDFGGVMASWVMKHYLTQLWQAEIHSFIPILLWSLSQAQ